MSEYKPTIKCCESFEKVIFHFDWHSFIDNGEKVFCMPSLPNDNQSVNYRINYCPICGKEIRNIELRKIK